MFKKISIPATLAVALLLTVCTAVKAEKMAEKYSVHKIYGDCMVLQREKPIRISGHAAPGESVRVDISGNHVLATAGDDGEWTAVLPAMEAGGPYVVNITGAPDSQPIIFKNVLIGDVWLASGQSNMEVPVDLWGCSPIGPKEAAKAVHPNIRFYNATSKSYVSPRKVQHEVVGPGWQPCSPETAAPFSAVAFYFGRQLNEDLNVPIGLISASKGGTDIEAWISSAAYRRAGRRRELLRIDGIDKSLDEEHSCFPSTLYNSMIAPWTGYPLRGFLWYQGENNAGAPEDYLKLQQLLISDWRTQWNDPKLPFLFVQLSSFEKHTPDKPLPDDYWVERSPENPAWASFREAQTATLRKVPYTGMAVSIDVGNHSDIHPLNKQPVGYRLAKEAERISYGRDIVSAGPMFKSMTVRDGKAIISFTNVGTGLEAKGSRDGQLGCFAIAGKDGKFVWANAIIDGDTVIVSSPEVKEPAAVRYGWVSYTGNLNFYNKDGFPACPFRTDMPDYVK